MDSAGSGFVRPLPTKELSGLAKACGGGLQFVAQLTRPAGEPGDDSLLVQFDEVLVAEVVAWTAVRMDAATAAITSRLDPVVQPRSNIGPQTAEERDAQVVASWSWPRSGRRTRRTRGGRAGRRRAHKNPEPSTAKKPRTKR